MRKLLGTAVVGVALMGTVLTGGAAVAGGVDTARSAPVTVAETGSAPAGPVAAAASCSKTLGPIKAKESVKFRKSAKLSATALGVWGKGQKGEVCNDGKASRGQSYRLCGKSSDKWYYGRTDRVTGWVPAACINW
ncbi:hypothetical protein [Streptomyces uncialis]|uniref:hypothetical protein n=1 Tax=Streptomyces uncialis TaxID=1048205 RepID=UPI00386F28B4|nr:hypothetical protein OG924_21045 [Streptomyces uncialis]